MDSSASSAGVKGDRALQSGDEDKLGFRDIAARIAASLVDHASDDGLVVGIDGPWGSGKSSLLYLIEEELLKLPSERRPSVVNFRPWLIGNRDVLLANLFALLSEKIDQVALQAGDASRTSMTKAKRAAEALRKFADGLGRAGAVVEVAGDATGFAIAKWIGRGLKALRDLVKDKPVEPPLSVLKERLTASLRDLGHRFIVTIDDVDRLEPREVIEVLRLARSVADFPNVIYLLCYDSGILSHSVKVAAKVESGKAYLEKIVQLTVMIPQPEPFQLRKWFTDELHGIASAKNDEELSRLKTVIDYEGGHQLKSPRAVKRALDSIRFFWPPLRDARADLADLVWLQFIKNGNHTLFRWIEEYCATAALLSLGITRVEEVERAKTLSTLHQIMEAGQFDDLMYRYYFAEQLPGLDVDYSADGKQLKVYQQVAEDVRNAAIRNRRLASPDHYRLYFALSGPSHALTQDNFDAVLRATEAGVDETEELILQLQAQEPSGSLSKVDILFERLRGASLESWTARQCTNLLLALSGAMDKAYRIRPFDAFWVGSLWDRAEKLVPVLLSHLDLEGRRSVLNAMFETGAAISWLTTLFRRETFAHGRDGERRHPKEDWLFTDSELDLVTKVIIPRYQSMSAEQVLEVINPLGLLFAWRQGGDEYGPKRLVENYIQTDEGLVRALEGLVSEVTSSSRGKVLTLKRDNLAPFLDYDHAKGRINGIAGVLTDRARTVAKAFDDGEEL